MSERAEASGAAFRGDADGTEALHRYQRLVNAVGDGIYQLDTDGHFVAVNDVIVEITGCAREKLLGEHVSEVVDDASAIERKIEQLLEALSEQSEQFELFIRTAEDEQVPCEVRMNPLVEDGTLQGTVGTVRDDIQMTIEESGAEITADSLPRVVGGPGQLRRVFQNLLDNAIEYSGDELPEVQVSAGKNIDERSSANAAPGAAKNADGWVISVSDEGVGIDPDEADRVFEVFQRLHTSDEHSGTGIGLALCDRIVERHGGDIWVESESGDGATFSFTLLPAGDDDE